MRAPRLSSSDLSQNVAANRRSSTRYFLDPVDVFVQDELGVVLEAQLINVSSEGAGLLLKVRPEREGYLRIDLPSRDEGGKRRVLARVKNIEPQDQHWRVGCVFCHRLSNPDLIALL